MKDSKITLQCKIEAKAEKLFSKMVKEHPEEKVSAKSDNQETNLMILDQRVQEEV